MLKNFVLDTVTNHSSNLPWDALKQMTGQITYGGRVTDEWDRVILNNLLHKYYSTSTLNTTKQYKFSRSDAYYVPFDCSLEGIRTYIATLELIIISD